MSQFIAKASDSLEWPTPHPIVCIL